MTTTKRRARDRREQGLGECVHTRTLDCGLTVLVALKPGFRKKYALLGTNYGSIDNDFTTELARGKQRMPAGIAHFLEHKMFEKPDGDVMDKLAAVGCSSNAMTSFNHTGYLIECTESFESNLEVLVDFVTNPWFTPELVEKEKGIIAEEINMYLDDPSWRGYMGVLESLFHNHPVALDIAGTVESIQDITADDLHLCHRTFYSPGNMHLAVAGDVDPDRVCEIAEQVMARNERSVVSFKRHRKAPRKKPLRRRHEEFMSVAGPKLHLGCRFDAKSLGKSVAEVEMCMDLFLAATIGKGTAFHSDLYKAGLIDDSYGYSASVEQEFAFVMVAADTTDPASLEKAIIKGIADGLSNGPHKDDLRRARRRFYGSFVRALDSVSTSCWNLIDGHVKGDSYLGHGRQLMKVPTSRILEIARGVLGSAAWASHVIRPTVS